jgi:plastocyanin
MSGTIFVHPRPGTSHFYVVGAGLFGNSPKYNSNINAEDVFFPENLTVHVGDTVEWASFFHTVTFASPKVITHLRHKFVLRKPGANGKWVYFANPAVVFPSSRNGCGTKTACSYSGGFLNSGLLQGGNSGPATFKVTFTKAGWYHYGCLVHPGMDGSIRVLPASGRGKPA